MPDHDDPAEARRMIAAEEARKRSRRNGRLRHIRIIRLIAAFLIGSVLFGLVWRMAIIEPEKPRALAHVVEAALLSLTVLTFMGGMAGRFSLTVGKRKEQHFSGSAAGVILWLWCFVAITVALLAWEILPPVTEQFPYAMADHHRQSVVMTRKTSASSTIKATLPPPDR